MSIAGFQEIGIIGAGQMGSGIAQVCATSGLTVTVVDVRRESLEKAQSVIAKSVAKLESKGELTSEQCQAAKSIYFSDSFESLKSCDLLIEAVIEDESTKRDVFLKLEKIVKSEAILASNTSSLPITRLASNLRNPSRFIGMHFMNPVPIMKLIEIIPGLQTDEQVTDRVINLAKGLGKEVTKSHDYPGFVVNRILMPMINEAFMALMEGVASALDIDKGMKLGTNQPMGPLALADFIGLDTCLAILKVLHSGLGDPKYRPSPLLQQYVDAGWLGKKTNKGVYSYA